MPDALSSFVSSMASRPLPNDRAGIATIAKQLEGVFLRELMKPLEDNSLIDGEPLIGGDADKQWKQLHLDALSERTAGGIGLAPMLAAELERKAGLR